MVKRVIARGVNGDPGGPPRVELDDNEIEQLKMMVEVGATQAEVAEYFGISQPTVSTKFGHHFAHGMAKQKISIRRQQMRAALDGNTSMLIWLGKQVLGQREPKDNEEMLRQAVLQAVQQTLGITPQTLVTQPMYQLPNKQVIDEEKK